MPGYNHYPNCTCGWCVAKPHSFTRDAGHGTIRTQLAIRFLQNNGAARLGSSCFVAPNATCPVCKASVYFYANTNGSRVFFDELGPPWTRHPCTDKPQFAARFTGHANHPQRRKLGKVREIIDHAKLIGGRRVPDIERPERPSLDTWRLLVVTRIRLNDNSVEIDAEFIETAHLHKIALIAQASCRFYVGQFVSLRGDLLSFFDENLEKQIEARVNYAGAEPFDNVVGNDHSLKETSAEELDQFGLPVGLKSEGIPGPNQRSHYIGPDASLVFFERMKAEVRAVAAAGALYLADFQIALDDQKIKTLRERKWKRDIVSGLIYDIRHEQELRNSRGARAFEAEPGVHPNRNREPKRGPDGHGSKVGVAQADLAKWESELREAEQRVLELEAAWDNATTSAQRQKIRDQLDSARRRRTKLLGLLQS